MSTVDVLIVAALPEEVAAAKAAGTTVGDGPGVRHWHSDEAEGVGPYQQGDYRSGDGGGINVVLARPVRMGGRKTATFTAVLADRLRPSMIAMSGVCAGHPEETSPGDIVVAEPAYEWDEGKWKAERFRGDHRHILLHDPVLRAVQDFDPGQLGSHDEPSGDESLLWMLDRLFRGLDPYRHPSRNCYIPPETWSQRLATWGTAGLIRQDPDGTLHLTDAGDVIRRRRLFDNVLGPGQLPYRVVPAPMASGSSVMEDPGIWTRLADLGMRKITALEMEAATIATVAHERQIPWLVAKGVMDPADQHKSDRYKSFAARASAEVLFALIGQVAKGPERKSAESISSLAMNGATTLVAAATTEVWSATRAGFARLFGRGDSDRETAVARRLDALANEVERAAPDQRAEALQRHQSAWQVRLADLMEDDQTAAEALKRLIEQVSHRLPASRQQWIQNVNASASGAIAQGAMFGNIINHPGPTATPSG